jgi:hypothetical protein
LCCPFSHSTTLIQGDRKLQEFGASGGNTPEEVLASSGELGGDSEITIDALFHMMQAMDREMSALQDEVAQLKTSVGQVVDIGQFNLYQEPVTLYKNSHEMVAPFTSQGAAMTSQVSSYVEYAKAGKSTQTNSCLALLGIGSKAGKATSKSSKANPNAISGVNFIRIYHDKAAAEYLVLPEVQVFVDVNGVETNVATCGTATQSSNLSALPDPNNTTPASKAIDGNTSNGLYANGSIAHTNNEVHPWWKAQLASNHDIVRVVIWNQLDQTGPPRLTGAIVELLDSSQNVIAWVRLGDTTNLVSINLTFDQFSAPPVV